MRPRFPCSAVDGKKRCGLSGSEGVFHTPSLRCSKSKVLTRNSIESVEGES